MSFLHRDGRAVRTIDNFRMVLPQDGGWSLTPMENLLRVLRSHDDMVSLELFAADGVVNYLVRAKHGESMGGMLHSYFPQARLSRRVDDGISEPDPGDWMFVDEDEYALVTPLGLEREGYLPLRIFDDRVIEQSKMDPLAGVIGMLASATRPGAESAGDRLGLRLLLKPAQAALQWSHRLSVVETLSGPCWSGREYLPSMGPPPFGGGNLTPPVYHKSANLRFNEATAFRWWKPALAPSTGSPLAPPYCPPNSGAVGVPSPSKSAFSVG